MDYGSKRKSKSCIKIWQGQPHSIRDTQVISLQGVKIAFRLEFVHLRDSMSSLEPQDSVDYILD